MVDFIYPLPKTHKKLHGAPGMLVISNSWFSTKNICVRLDFDLNSIATKVKLCIKDINDFFKKLQNLHKHLNDT